MTINEQIAIPVGNLSIIAMRGCEEFAAKVDEYIRKQRGIKSSCLIKASCPRFATGEAKGLIAESVRGQDLFIICDPFDYSVTYKMQGMTVPMSPDDHFCDLKRIISAASGKSRRINVIMPMLYEGRQHRRTARESLDCALMLQELTDIGAANILTFDAHDPRVQNAIPSGCFENIMPYYQMIKSLHKVYPDVAFDFDKTMVVSPDEGGMGRCIYYSSILGIDLGMFYKRRDYSRLVHGRNPIIAHEFLGDNVEGKDIIVCDDMISSGDSILDIAVQLKQRKARRLFVFATFGLFCEGTERFDEAYKNGLIDKVFTTNLNYRTPELRSKEWYQEVDMSKYVALLIDTL
ncbi:MAG: ribose-phosphate pyrophosphokinase, partial [Clostridia bacterium]|nr:ribose-phosphate pyrophosphokinase [Clostridia bacterium]